MVFPLKLTKFYGSSLPRPRIYVNPNGNERIDPPISVTDPLMSWAQEAHWSMGGVSFKRLRLMGKIEGNIGRLRNQREKEDKEFKAQAHNKSPISNSDLPRSKISDSPLPSKSPSPPPAPIASKRRRLVTLLEEEEKGEEIRVSAPVTRRRRLVKKLGDDFDRVASPENKKSDEVVVSDSTVVTPKRSRRLVKIGDAGKKIVEEKENKKVVVVVEEGEKSPNSGIRVRTSPRLAKIK
ncbi:uncharacterized protein LOC123899715 [Trifolium pratense]|uniref:uncharacterized protein LOC123899715 n=1 Tax=Trifolium pratense TaxID=57577 RepID=UPI001E69346D|nr:uncharacterized protein LOC123899715 [Trifolium pratense]